MKSAIIIGDTGGNPGVLASCLSQAGVQASRVPRNLVIIHVGDVIRCHPKFLSGNEESVNMIREMLHKNPESYIQLIGNHESAALGGPARPDWNISASVDAATVAKLQEMWSVSTLRLAVALKTFDLGDTLITHAGLTRALWAAIGMPPTAEAAAKLINQNLGRKLSIWARAGSLVDVEDPLADVTWAEVIHELSLPWISAGDSPFSQIHGHASPYNWQTEDWWPDAPVELRQRTQVDINSRRTTTWLSPTTRATSVDWNLGNIPLAGVPMWPLLTLNLRQENCHESELPS